MVTKGFTYIFTTKELLYLLFKKKECPKCRNIMEKEKRYEMVCGADVNSKADPFFVKTAEVKKYYYVFKCRHCCVEYTLKELTDK